MLGVAVPARRQVGVAGARDLRLAKSKHLALHLGDVGIDVPMNLEIRRSVDSSSAAPLLAAEG
jgi:hypothetical protein